MSSTSGIQREININNYIKKGRISQGSFGIVYKVQDIKSEEIYAAKIIDCQDKEDLCNQIIDREVKIMSSINHPTIIKFIGYSRNDFQGENNVVIIMQFAQNGTLAEILKKIQDNIGPSDFDNTTRQIIIIGIARGMKYLHDRNIIHRDLKTDNILLDDEYHPLITDFGLSKFFEVGHSYSQTKHCGTLIYKAPEILRNEKFNIKADVYSFAILMFQIVTDLFPYPDLSNKKITDFDFQNNVMNHNYRPKFTVPVKECIKNLIEDCWSDDPKQRPNFTEIFNKLCQEEYFLDDVDTEQLRFYIEDITEIKDPIDKMQKIIDDYEKKFSQMQREKKEMKDELDQYKNDISSIKEKLKYVKKENKLLESNMAKSKEKSDKISQENEKIKLDLKEFKEKSENISQENEELKLDLTKSKEKNEDNALVRRYYFDMLNDYEFIMNENYLMIDTNKIIDGEIIVKADKYNNDPNELSPDYFDIRKVTFKDKKGEFVKSQLNLIRSYKFHYEYLGIFANKIKNQSALDHIAILPTIGFSVENNNYSVYTPYMINGSLDILIEKANQGRVTDLNPNWDTISACCILGIAVGMSYIHHKSIYHRNLKASNILLDEDFLPKISGFAQSIYVFGSDNLKCKLNANFGCVINRAPECSLDNFGHYNKKVDVYSYGMLLYHILLLKSPWNDSFGKQTNKRSIYDYQKAIINGERPVIPKNSISDKFYNLIHRCWDSNPDNRPSFDEIVKEFIDFKEEYFDFDMVDEVIFDDYIEKLNIIDLQK